MVTWSPRTLRALRRCEASGSREEEFAEKTKVRATLVLDENALSKSVAGHIAEPADEVS